MVYNNKKAHGTIPCAFFVIQFSRGSKATHQCDYIFTTEDKLVRGEFVSKNINAGMLELEEKVFPFFSSEIFSMKTIGNVSRDRKKIPCNR